MDFAEKLDMMDDDCDIQGFSTEKFVSQHKGESCENCIYRDECENHLLDYALWCMLWDGDENVKTKG